MQDAIAGVPLNTPSTIKLTGNIADLQTVEIPEGKKITLKADSAVTLTCPNKNTGGYKHFHVQKNASLTLEGNITLQGAHYGNNAQYALYIEEGGTAESKNNVRITGFKNNYHGTVCTAGTLIMSGGKIDGNKTRYGGGVYVYGGGTFTMKGGTITDNDAVNHGGAVSVSGTFNWEGGSITGNSCSSEIIYTEGSGTVNNPHGYTAS